MSRFRTTVRNTGRGRTSVSDSHATPAEQAIVVLNAALDPDIADDRADAIARDTADRLSEYCTNGGREQYSIRQYDLLFMAAPKVGKSRHTSLITSTGKAANASLWSTFNNLPSNVEPVFMGVAGQHVNLADPLQGEHQHFMVAAHIHGTQAIHNTGPEPIHLGDYIYWTMPHMKAGENGMWEPASYNAGDGRILPETRPLVLDRDGSFSMPRNLLAFLAGTFTARFEEELEGTPGYDFQQSYYYILGELIQAKRNDEATMKTVLEDDKVKNILTKEDVTMLMGVYKEQVKKANSDRLSADVGIAPAGNAAERRVRATALALVTALELIRSRHAQFYLSKKVGFCVGGAVSGNMMHVLIGK